jgi:excisionase family DNA binding protein
MMTLEVEGETYYTAAEAAKFLGISRDTFYRTVRAQLIPYQVGVLKRTYYKQSDLEKLKGVRPVED